MKMAVGSDGICNLTNIITKYLESKEIELVRYGALAGEKSDYVDAAHFVAKAVASGDCEQGLLFCNTGTGVTIVANKVPGVRAVLCCDPFSAKIAKLANNANVIVLGIRLTGEKHAIEIVDEWLATEPATSEPRVTFHRKTQEIDEFYRKK